MDIHQRIEQVRRKGDVHLSNCWNVTMRVFDSRRAPAWVTSGEMLTWLDRNTTEIPRSRVKVGDIVALFDRRGVLLHTEIIVGRPRGEMLTFGKHGSCSFEQSALDGGTIARVIACYEECGVEDIIFFRMRPRGAERGKK